MVDSVKERTEEPNTDIQVEALQPTEKIKLPETSAEDSIAQLRTLIEDVKTQNENLKKDIEKLSAPPPTEKPKLPEVVTEKTPQVTVKLVEESTEETKEKTTFKEVTQKAKEWMGPKLKAAKASLKQFFKNMYQDMKDSPIPGVIALGISIARGAGPLGIAIGAIPHAINIVAGIPKMGTTTKEKAFFIARKVLQVGASVAGGTLIHNMIQDAAYQQQHRNDASEAIQQQIKGEVAQSDALYHQQHAYDAAEILKSQALVGTADKTPSISTTLGSVTPPSSIDQLASSPQQLITGIQSVVPQPLPGMGTGIGSPDSNVIVPPVINQGIANVVKTQIGTSLGIGYDVNKPIGDIKK